MWDGVVSAIFDLEESPKCMACISLASVCGSWWFDLEQLHNHLLLCYITRLFLTNAVTSQPGQGAYTAYPTTIYYQHLCEVVVTLQ